MALEFSGVKLPRHNFTLELDVNIDDEVTGVFGHSGAGKTSLLHLVAGLERPAAGRLTFNGRIFFDMEKRLWVPPHRRRIGMVFQNARLFPHLDVRKNLLFATRFMKEKTGTAYFEEIVSLLELGPLLDHAPAKISGGEAQRVALGRALLSCPEMLLLDEPFSAIDMVLRRQILPFLWRIRQHFNIPMLVISHDLPDILRLTDKLLLLDSGAVVGKGALADLAMRHDFFSAAGHASTLNVFELEVVALENDDCLVLSENTASPLTLYGVTRPGLKPGCRVKAAIAPDDVLISLTDANPTSARNMLPGRILRVSEHPSRTFCQIDLGGDRVILAEITRDSLRRLDLRIGARVSCMFKASSIDILPECCPSG